MSKSIEVRTAKSGDANDTAAIYLESRKELVAFAPVVHSDEEVHSWIKEQLIPSGGVLVAELKGKLVGMCSLSEAEEVDWIDNLYLKPSEVRKGIGTALLREALARVGRPCRLYTFQENRAARQFYEKQGFEAIEFSDGSANEENVPDVLYELV
ncbi:GNAT family N-acetyltransferase [Agarivorans albus]|uniref:GNAT family N-acetyltransferase n=1 Tax=Agarivorans albus TaxID=182262 RepID=UPI00058DA9A1|nr:GNAT family N-acetyltransferase [Agarivorans albus]